jgi:dolichol-phosphate mannosyltransferase
LRDLIETERSAAAADPLINPSANQPRATDSPEISAVLPVFNEVESLAEVVDELERVLESTRRSFEVILVDDGSGDGSGAWIEDRARRDPWARGILLEKNVGQSGAIAAGLTHARGSIVITLDADGQNDPSSIPALLDALRDADVVSGVRAHRADSWRRRASSRVANAVRRAVIGDTITDVGCSLKAYRREALQDLPLFVGAHRFLPALCQFRGARVAEVPVLHRPRRHGVSKYGVGNRLFRGIRDLFGVRWLKSRLLRHKIRRMTHG